MTLKRALFIVLGLSLSEVVISQGFCKTFRENEAIDYGYSNIMNDRFLIIGQRYWRLQNMWLSKQGQKDPSLYLKLGSGVGKRVADWFGSQYSVAFETSFCGYIGVAKVCKLMTGIVNKKKEESYHTIDWAVIDYDYNAYSLNRSKDYERIVLNSSRIAFDSDFEPSFGFQFLGYYTCFVQQNKFGAKHHQVFRRSFRCFTFDGNTGNASEVTNFVVSALKREMKKNAAKMKEKGFTFDDLGDHILTDLSDTRKLIAIFYDFHLFQENEFVITYCPSQSFFFNLVKFTDYMKAYYEGRDNNELILMLCELLRKLGHYNQARIIKRGL